MSFLSRSRGFVESRQAGRLDPVGDRQGRAGGQRAVGASAASPPGDLGNPRPNPPRGQRGLPAHPGPGSAWMWLGSLLRGSRDLPAGAPRRSPRALQHPCSPRRAERALRYLVGRASRGARAGPGCARIGARVESLRLPRQADRGGDHGSTAPRRSRGDRHGDARARGRGVARPRGPRGARRGRRRGLGRRATPRRRVRLVVGRGLLRSGRPRDGRPRRHRTPSPSRGGGRGRRGAVPAGPGLRERPRGRSSRGGRRALRHLAPPSQAPYFERALAHDGGQAAPPLGSPRPVRTGGWRGHGLCDRRGAVERGGPCRPAHVVADGGGAGLHWQRPYEGVAPGLPRRQAAGASSSSSLDAG